MSDSTKAEILEQAIQEIKLKFKNSHNWTFRRIAWEYLIRNNSFQEDCNKADNTNNKKYKEEIAKKYHLQKYKSHTSKYSKAMPQFDTLCNRFWLPTTGKNKKYHKIGKEESTIVIKIDLLPIAANKSILNNKIRHLKKIIDKELNKIKTTNSEIYKQNKKSKELCLKNLKVLDLLEKGISQRTSIIEIFKSNTIKDKDQVYHNNKKNIKIAKLFRDTEYYLLAMHDDTKNTSNRNQN